MASQKSNLSRRQFLKMVSIGSASLALAACAAPSSTGQTGGSSGAAAQNVTLNFFAWGDASDIPGWDALGKKYTEKAPNVTVKISPTPTGDYYTKLQTQFAGGLAPDVASFQGWEWQPYADKKLLAPIDDYITRDQFNAPYAEKIQSIEQTTLRRGKRYLIPTQIAAMVMFYAKKHFDDAGLAYPTDDWTFEQFVDIAQKLSKTAGDKKRYGYQPNGNWFRDIHWIRATGKQEFDQLEDPKKATFDQPEIVEIIQMVEQDFRYKMNISPTPADLANGANTIEAGNSALKYEGPWYFPVLNSPDLRKDNKQVEFDVVLMPKGKDESRPHRGWSEGVVLPQGKQVEAAWGFAHFISSEEGQKLYASMSGRMPNTTALIESFWLPTIQEKFGVKNGKALIQAIKNSEVDVISGVTRGKLWSDVVKPVGWDPIINNSAKAADVLPKVNEGVQKLLDEYWAKQG
ncbi:MAG: extracellular solute-binding protein [Caldilineaceae bacterium]